MMELIRQIMQQMRLLTSRATLTRTHDDTPIQRIQAELLADEVRDMARPQDYGLTSVPLNGAQCVTLSLSGERQQSIAIRVDDGRHRPAGLQPGEVCLYTDEGDIIHFKRGRHIAIESSGQVSVKAGGKVTVDAPNIEATGAIQVKLVSGATTVTATPSNTTIASPSIVLDGPVICTKTLAVTQTLTAVGGAMSATSAGLEVNGEVADSTGTMTTMRATYNTHNHKGDSGGNTAPPNQAMT